jgi:ParB-like chromosome segregation protein Spo0J
MVVNAQIASKMIVKKLPAADIDLSELRPIDPEHVEEMRARKKQGAILPMPVVMPVGDRFRTVFHNHSLLALTADGEEFVECRVTDRELEDKEILLEAVRENESGKDFAPIEQLRLYSGLLHAWGWSQEELASHLGKSPSNVSRIIKRGKLLHPTLFKLFSDGTIPDRAATAISKLPLDQQLAFYERAKGWKVERIEKEVRKLLGKAPKRERKNRVKTPNGMEAAWVGSLDAALEEAIFLAKAIRNAIRVWL